MDTPGTLALAISCTSCKTPFRARARSAAPRSAWRQQSALRADGEAVTAYLCDQCSARFSSEEAALDYLAGELEEALRGERKPSVVVSAG